jgi:hypothetical protein
LKARVTMRAKSNTPKRVAILGWGSLIWKAATLRDALVGGDRGEAAWHEGGPPLPIEFSRISGPKQERYLSLVIDRKHGVLVPTRLALSSRLAYEEARIDLADREHTAIDQIAVVDLATGRSSSREVSVRDAVRRWARSTKVAAVVWTDLPPNFGQGGKGGPKAFSTDEALTFLRDLVGPSLIRAREYMTRAPREVDTPVRRQAYESGWLARPQAD